MKTTRKSTDRLCATTAIVAALVLPGTSALAFDEVHWKWTTFIDEYFDKDIRIDVTFEPSGMLKLQDLQVSIGDIQASSIITPGDPDDPGQPGVPGIPGGPTNPNGDLTHDISNVVYYYKTGDRVYELKLEYDQTEGGIRDSLQPGDAGDEVETIAAGLWGPGEIIGYTTKGSQDEFTDVVLGADDLLQEFVTPRDSSNVDIEYVYDPYSGAITDGGNLVATVAEKAGETSALSNTSLPPGSPQLVTPQIETFSVVNVPHAIGLDATVQLPEVVSVATAVANNVSIASDVMIELHDTQVAFGGFAEQIDPDAAARVGGVFGNFYQPDQVEGGLTESDVYTGNLGVASALALLVAGAEGLITPGTVTALSDVEGILNASVDSAATAVANNKSITLVAVTPADAVLIGDVTQFAYMDVAAISNVQRVVVTGYTGLGQLDRPLVSSVATAVGNNLNVDVTSPGVIE